MKRRITLLATIATGFVVSGCTGGTNPIESSVFSSASSSSSSSSSSEESSVFESSEAEESSEDLLPKKTKLDFMPVRELLSYSDRSAFPSTGEQRCLVLPIEFDGYSYDSEELKKIDAVLNGKGPEDTLYWESLSTFYEKSSYGSLKISYDVAEPYLAKDDKNKPLTPEGVYNYYGPGDGSRADYGLYLIQNAYNQFIDLHGVDALKQYDGDHDGFLDGIIAVYACPDYVTGRFEFDKIHYYWAYTSWAGLIGSGLPNLDILKQDVDKPGVSVYFWTSNHFMYDSNYVYRHPGAVDPHTYIHESGHMLGLDDYYPSDSSFSPLGGLDMMDMNILDHNCYSKMVLGWADPYVVRDSVDITIGSFEETGDFILLPTENWNGTPYDEYILIELYTPTGLNELDSKHQLNWSRPLGYQEPGVRIFHVDARIMECKMIGTSGGYESAKYISSLEDIGKKTDSNYLIAASNNARKSAPTDSNFSLIHMIESDRTNSFETGEIASDANLFHAGDYFDINRYSDSFTNYKAMNNGEDFPYRVFIDAIDETGATIGIEKIR